MQFFSSPGEEVQLQRFTDAGSNNTSVTVWTDPGLSIPATPPKDFPMWLWLYVGLPQVASTNALIIEVVPATLATNVEATSANRWLRTTYFPGGGFVGGVPINLRNPIPAGTDIPALKVRYRTSVAGQAAVFTKPDVLQPDVLATTAILALLRRQPSA